MLCKGGIFLGIVVLIVVGIACDSAAGNNTNPSAEPTNAPAGVAWLHDWDEALEQAQFQNTPIMINFYTQRCPACKALDQDTFSNEEAAPFFNNNFICFKSNAETSNLARNYYMTGVPTTHFTTPDGTTMGYFTGYAPPEYYLLVAEEALNRWHNEFNE